MLKRSRQTLFLTALIALGGCQTLVIDEAFVFRPGQFGDPNAPRTGQMRYEHVFHTPTDMKIDVWADGQKAQHVIRSDDFVKSTVNHGNIKVGQERIAITRIERAGTDRPLIVHCGGNASDRYESGTLYAQKMISFADILMFDYPGYGDSTGQADAQSLSQANKAIATYVSSDLGDRRPLILWGHSLGGFVCADMVQYLPATDGIVLETTAANADDVAKIAMPWYVKLFIKPRISDSLGAYDLVDSLRSLDAPILVLGAAKDKTLPVGLSRKLAQRLSEAGTDISYVEFPDANHISVPVQKAYAPMIARFISGLDEKSTAPSDARIDHRP